jgi:hypothetical protein
MREREHRLLCCSKDLDEQDLMNLFGFRMWEILIFKMISATENSK